MANKLKVMSSQSFIETKGLISETVYVLNDLNNMESFSLFSQGVGSKGHSAVEIYNAAGTLVARIQESVFPDVSINIVGDGDTPGLYEHTLLCQPEEFGTGSKLVVIISGTMGSYLELAFKPSPPAVPVSNIRESKVTGSGFYELTLPFEIYTT